MRDLDIAKRRLADQGFGLSIVNKARVIYESASRGLSGLLDAIGGEGEMLKGASVADRIVGKAAALLCAYAEVEAVYATTLSKEAKVVLEQHDIYSEWVNLVEGIMDVDLTGSCPFEKFVANISSPTEAYEGLKVLCENLRDQGLR